MAMLSLQSNYAVALYSKILCFSNEDFMCISNVKISYHCISCKKGFNDMESANDHVRSTNHEIMEKITTHHSDASEQMFNQINF